MERLTGKVIRPAGGRPYNGKLGSGCVITHFVSKIELFINLLIYRELIEVTSVAKSNLCRS